MLRNLLADFARSTEPKLVGYISTEVAFPSTMVDRITPARNEATLALAAEMTGCEDSAAIECEAFRQWVIEDHFPTGRPEWEKGGALFAVDVRPFEDMKLRMLNGSHSMIAYAGFLAGHRYVRDAMADPVLSRVVQGHLRAAAATLDPLPGVNFADYSDELSARFRNPHLAHETYQIAMDGTEKMPQRILAPAQEAARRGHSLAPFAFAVAAWMRYTTGKSDGGVNYDLRDPREADLRLPDECNAGRIMAHLNALRGLVPDELKGRPDWHRSVEAHLERMLSSGMQAAIEFAADGN